MHGYGITTAEALEAACRLAAIMPKLDTETEIACIKENPSIGLISKILLIWKIRKIKTE